MARASQLQIIRDQLAAIDPAKIKDVSARLNAPAAMPASAAGPVDLNPSMYEQTKPQYRPSALARIGGILAGVSEADLIRQHEAQQAEDAMAPQLRALQLAKLRAASGLDGRELMAFMTNPGEYGKNLSTRFGAANVEGGASRVFGEPGTDGASVFTAPKFQIEDGAGVELGPEGMKVLGRLPRKPEFQVLKPGEKLYGLPMDGSAPAAAASASAPAAPPSGPVYDQIRTVGAQLGAPPEALTYLQRLAQVESNGNAMARNGSSTGVFQFHPDTFASVGGGDINSVADQTKAALALAARDRKALTDLGIEPTDANTYIMHQQGAGGGKALLTAPPEVNAIAAIAPAYGGNMARARQAIVNNGGTPDMTAGEFVGYWQNRWGGPGADAPMMGGPAGDQIQPPGGMQPIASGGQVAQARAATVAEKAAYGIPADIPAQIKPDGSIDTISVGNGRGSGKLAATDSKYISEARTAAQQLTNALPLVNRFVALNEEVGTGGALGVGVVSGPASLFSPKIAEMKAITDRLTPAMRQGMPGAASDRDVAMFQSATVGLGKPGPANQSVAAAMKAATKRQQDYVAYLEDYARKNGSLLGAQEEWDAYAAANPMFNDQGSGVLKLNKTEPWRQYFGETPSSGQGQAAKVEKGSLPPSIYSTRDKLKAAGRLDPAAPMGSERNPFVARDQSVVDQLEKRFPGKKIYVITPDGFGVLE